ncbi:MAG TPA: bifunctional 5,10-methylenetetrahydrofolate dehydrogenase/5,10-methenyltetrahydrofolate cyclohydrolase [Solirubrobacteraceae bacterium]|jgi:methylenetetrahydrofolate dehydrogenase (NADP+)/methenyltetrahydrofolate cyclohydrolase|nr:bifunctional 5,10-methylenetetrahydrofolate dehydrogenase/5,10-methenyltetrahydrofolate cyclohydrolase [Solirubrobacteraceae bacterium]
MAGQILDGRAYARELLDAVARRVAALDGPAGIATLLIGGDEASAIYQRRIDAGAREVGLASRVEQMPADAAFEDVAARIAEVDADPEITGILVLRPVPAHLPEERILQLIPPHKDVEAQHPENAGLLALGTPRFVPSTPAAAFLILDRHLHDQGRDPATAYDGIDVVVVGRSTNVGKPAAILALARNATVVSADVYASRAGRLAEHTLLGDVLIVAAGVPHLITADLVRPGAIVVDIGINVVDDGRGGRRITGDVDFDGVIEVASAVSPVPGGVGPVTDAWVLHNTALSAERAAGIERPADARALLDTLPKPV